MSFKKQLPLIAGRGPEFDSLTEAVATLSVWVPLLSSLVKFHCNRDDNFHRSAAMANDSDKWWTDYRVECFLWIYSSCRCFIGNAGNRLDRNSSCECSCHIAWKFRKYKSGAGSHYGFGNNSACGTLHCLYQNANPWDAYHYRNQEIICWYVFL